MKRFNEFLKKASGLKLIERQSAIKFVQRRHKRLISFLVLNISYISYYLMTNIHTQEWKSFKFFM